MELCLTQTDMVAGCSRSAPGFLGPAAALPRQINLPCRDRYSIGTRQCMTSIDRFLVRKQPALPCRHHEFLPATARKQSRSIA